MLAKLTSNNLIIIQHIISYWSQIAVFRRHLLFLSCTLFPIIFPVQFIKKAPYITVSVSPQQSCRYMVLLRNFICSCCWLLYGRRFDVI